MIAMMCSPISFSARAASSLPSQPLMSFSAAASSLKMYGRFRMSKVEPKLPMLPPETEPMSICPSRACSTHLCSLHKVEFTCTLVWIRPLDCCSSFGPRNSLNHQCVGTVGAMPLAMVRRSLSCECAGAPNAQTAAAASAVRPFQYGFMTPPLNIDSGSSIAHRVCSLGHLRAHLGHSSCRRGSRRQHPVYGSHGPHRQISLPLHPARRDIPAA